MQTPSMQTPNFHDDQPFETRRDVTGPIANNLDSISPLAFHVKKEPGKWGRIFPVVFLRDSGEDSPRCFRVGSWVSLLTLQPVLFGPVLPGQTSTLRVRGREAICLRDLPSAFHQAGHYAGAPEEDGPSFGALYQGEEAAHSVAFEPSHLHGTGFPEGIWERGPATAATVDAEEAVAASTSVAFWFVIVESLPSLVWLLHFSLSASNFVHKEENTSRCQVINSLRSISLKSRRLHSRTR